MTPLDLALTYMTLFYTNGDLEALGDLLADDLIFEGPLYRFASAEAYLDSLREAPPTGMHYTLIKTFVDETSVCLIYQFTKPGVSVPMAQLFEVATGKIRKITLIFDTGPFR